MATRIVFAGGSGEGRLSVRVEEDVNDVWDAWRAAQGLAFALTRDGSDDEKVWVNPATIAYWEEARSNTPTFHQPAH
jgi:hypothetical protein